MITWIMWVLLFVRKLDLLKGYWQIPLTPHASQISAFVTPDSFAQYTVMALGMRNVNKPSISGGG